MISKFALRKKCLEKRKIFFKKKGSECLKFRDIEVIILEIKSKHKILSIGLYYPINSEISPLKLIEICENLNKEEKNGTIPEDIIFTEKLRNNN